MPTKRCRECGEDFDIDEGVGRVCGSCFMQTSSEDGDPAPVDVMMARRRKNWFFSEND